MTLVKYSDFNGMPTTFSSLLDKFFNESVNSSRLQNFRPGVDIVETDKSYEIQLAAPGMNKEDFVLDINDGVLIISGERKFEKKEEGKNFHSIETQYGKFSRTFNLPDHVVASKINATYTNGILSIDIPKDEKKTLKTSVKVK